MSALFVAWRGGTPDSGQWGPVGRLDYERGVYRFFYTRGAKRLHHFRPFMQMTDLNQVYESDELFPLFANRLFSPSRREYEDFLRWGGFSLSHPPDPIAILGVTEGIRQTDSIEVFPCPLPDSEGCYVNKFFLHGVRWLTAEEQRRVNQLGQDESLYLEPEPTNRSDRNAVAVFADFDAILEWGPKNRVGYVPRYLAQDVKHLLQKCGPEIIQLTVERSNPDAPMQHRVLCKMIACWPSDFRPCSTDDYLPIPSGVDTRCKA